METGRIECPLEGNPGETLMNHDDEICYCFHVSMRKLINFSKRTRPKRASQMTECLNAGTGCGWCIPFLESVAKDPDHFDLDGLTAEQYASKRTDYRGSGSPKNTFKKEGESGEA